MPAQHEPMELMRNFRSSLERVVELGYGEDDCGQATTIMFHLLVQEINPGASKKLHIAGRPVAKTCAELLTESGRVLDMLEKEASAVQDKKRSPVLFPFMTTLGISGGMFLLSFHISRIAQVVIPNVMG